MSSLWKMAHRKNKNRILTEEDREKIKKQIQTEKFYKKKQSDVEYLIELNDEYNREKLLDIIRKEHC